MRAAETSLLNIFLASRKAAKFSLGTMSNAETALHNSVGAIAGRALASNSLAIF